MRISDTATVLVRRTGKVVYHDGDRVIKVFAAGKPAGDVMNEALNLARVESIGVRVPGLLEVSQVEEGPHAGCWALATRYVPGLDLLELMTKEPDRAEACITDLVAVQLEAQGFRAPLLTRQYDKVSRMISASKGQLDATRRYELGMRVEGMRRDAGVCHGDLVPSNVIVGEDGLLYLCDWSHATAGPAEVDVAATYLRLSIYYPELAERYLDIYCADGQLERDLVTYWMPVVAAAELSRGREEEREVLVKRALEEM